MPALANARPPQVALPLAVPLAGGRGLCVAWALRMAPPRKRPGHADRAVTIAVDASTWKPPCRTPLPTRPIVYSLDFATRMLLDPQKPLQENAKVWAWSYIYDHMENCLGETV